VKTVPELESELKQLPPQERINIARRLLEELNETSIGIAGNVTSHDNVRPPMAQPDYAGRRKRIFGDKVLPNLVIESRAEDRW
jgi:hypothetical protein